MDRRAYWRQREVSWLRGRREQLTRAQRCWAISDNIAEELRLHGVEPLYDGELCGYRFNTRKSTLAWHLYPGEAGWDRALQWLPPYVAGLLRAHVALWPAYSEANSLC